jgi:hypothetical protein
MSPPFRDPAAALCSYQDTEVSCFLFSVAAYAADNRKISEKIVIKNSTTQIGLQENI